MTCQIQNCMTCGARIRGHYKTILHFVSAHVFSRINYRLPWGVSGGMEYHTSVLVISTRAFSPTALIKQLDNAAGSGTAE